MGVWLGLEPRDDVAAPVNRHLSVDDVARDAFLLQLGPEQLDGVGEGDEHQHLVAGLLDDLQHGVEAVGDVELQHRAIIRVDCTSADLEQLVQLGRRVDRADLLPISLDEHLALQQGVVFALLRRKRRFALDVGDLWQVEAILLLEPYGRL